MNIIFICKHNVFRSRVAEAVFKKYYKGSKYKAKSRGIFPGDYVYKNTIRSVKSIGYNIKGMPKELRYEELQVPNIIVVVADDVPKNLFSRYKKIHKLIKWNFPDTDQGDTKSIQRISKNIESKVKSFAKRLKWNLKQKDWY